MRLYKYIILSFIIYIYIYIRRLDDGDFGDLAGACCRSTEQRQCGHR